MPGQIQGSEAILQALEQDHDIQLILVDREKDTEVLRKECANQNIPLEEGSTNDLWRMSASGHTDALALLGREPHGTLEEIFERGGSIWLLDGVQYPTNLGFGIRTIEVSGADAVVLNISRTHQDRRTIRRSSMRADRFIPVVYSDTTSIINEAKKNGFRIIAAEDIGTIEPWNTNLTGNVLFVVGAEREGVSQEVLEACDEIVRLPMDGFVPSYNLQVAISVLAVEALRQRQGH
ncbi:MAG: RNA methyltransferase [Candidatus Poseidoniaceae archaeon]|nr:RNA methyltransferase [Candidatus Poseidoniaceae archaeon]